MSYTFAFKNNVFVFYFEFPVFFLYLGRVLFSVQANMNRRSCKNNADNFCYICGKYTVSDQQKNITHRVKVAYQHYFGCKLG